MKKQQAVQDNYDAVIIGAGAGGLATATWLTSKGKRVLLVDDKDKVGGRATSYQIEGFTVNEGAIAIELGSTFEEIMNAVGMQVDVREPSPATVFMVDGKIVNPAKGGWGFLLGGMTKAASKIGAKFADARKGELPDGNISTEAWLKGFTKNKTVHNLFRNFCAAIWAANADELPARAFLTYFGQKGAFKRFGFCPRGTLGIWQDMATGIRNNGGEVWLNAQVQKITLENGKCTGVELTKDGESVFIQASCVVSNAGPKITSQLVGQHNLDAEYMTQVHHRLRPAANIVYNFATQERLIDVPGLVTFANTEYLCNLGELTATCPELAPPGWYLYVAYAVPRPSLSDFAEKSQIEAGLNDLRQEFAGFDDKAKLLNIRVMRGEWPAQRSCSGYDMAIETPISNLWNVGDGVKEYGDGGTQACAIVGKAVAEQVIDYLDA